MKNIFKQYLQYAQAKGAQEIEIFLQESKEDSIEVREQKIEKLHTAIDKGLAVRVLCNKRQGFSYVTSFCEEDIYKTIEQAIDSSEYADPDEYLQFPKPKKITKKNLKLFDKSIINLTPPERIKIAKDLEKTAYSYDKKIKKTETAGFNSGLIQTTLINSHGVFQQEKRTFCGVSLEVIAADKKHMEAGYDYQYTTNFKKLNPALVAHNAASKAILMLTAEDIFTGTYDILLTPKVSINFLSVILSMFCADNIQKNKSLLKNKLNKKIGSEKLTIFDNPFLIRGLGSFLYDGEGIPGQSKTIIQNGILKKYLYDIYTANKEKTKSTGNAIRYSFKAEPGIGASNLYIKPGTNTNKQLLKKITKGIAVHNVMGLHTADPISGQFSLGAVGQLIENGKLAKAVKNIAIAGNLLDFLSSLSAVGADLEFNPDNGVIGSPSLIIKNIQVVGKKTET